MAFSPHAVAQFSARRPWFVVAGWVAVLVVAVGLIVVFLATATTTTADISSSPDSKIGKQLLEDRLRGPDKARESIVIRSATYDVDDPQFKAMVDNIMAGLADLGPTVIATTFSYYQTGVEDLVSNNRNATIIPVTMAGDLDEATRNVPQVIDVVHANNGENGFEVYISGVATVGNDFSHAAERDIVRGEMIGGTVAIIILLLVLGAVVAAFIPLLMAIVAICAAIAMTAVVGQAFSFSFFAINMIIMMGLAVGIDYSLFIVSRYREERSYGRPVAEAVDNASATAGRAVLFSGLTVIIALLGMLIVPSTIYRSLAMGAIFVVSFSIIASLTLLPAVLSLLGDKINALRIPFMKAQQTAAEERPGGFWDKIAGTVMKHPVISVVGVTGVLLAAAVPYFNLNAGSAGVSTLPPDFDSAQGFAVISQEFRGSDVSPAEIVIDGDADSQAVQTAVTRLEALVANDPVFGGAQYITNEAGDLGLLSLQLTVDPFREEANDGIERLREQYIPEAFAGVDAEVYVSGQSAINLDSINMTADYTPIVFAFVLGLSFLLLMMVFRSIVVPAKAIIMNLLSVGAAYGLIVLVIQEGFLNEVFGFQQVETIEFWLPLFLFSVLFGLSMDYHVFLLSRIKERYDQMGDNTEAVAHGLRTTGRLITGAALIMVAVFGGFAMGELVMMQQIGFGLGVSVLIDATIIRSILVPASMKLLGKWNWYFPSFLNWLPHFGIEESTPPSQQTHASSKLAGEIAKLSGERR